MLLRKLLITSSVFCGAYLSAITIAQANLLTNGSFESPVVTGGTFSNFNSGSVLITGWTVTGPQVSIVSGTFVQGALFPAFDGAQWLDLTGLNSNTIEGVTQTVATIPGNTYQLSYAIGTTAASGFGPSSTVNVLINSAAAFSDTTSTANQTIQVWQTFAHTFVASGAFTSLTFLNGDSGADNDNGLDNVVLLDLGVINGNPSPVPEPASIVLFIVGVAGLGLGLMIQKARTRRVICQ
jgi:hypothetical protein